MSSRIPPPARHAVGLARAALYPAAEWLWSAAASGAGRAHRARYPPGTWTTDGRRRVVIVAPHPDDETVGAGGAAALHVGAGDTVTIVVVTDGGGSGALGLPTAEMARRRALEVRTAADTLGIRDLRLLGLPEWSWTEEEARPALAAPLADADVVYAPSCVDYHPEHVRVARLIAGLLREAQLVRVCELGVPLTPLLANRVADLREVAEKKARALAAFHTQTHTLRGLRRLALYRARFYGLTAAEVFWELDAAAYARVVAAGDWRPGTSPYRGIRIAPLGDPLSMLSGLGARTRLGHVVGDASRAPAGGGSRLANASRE